MIYRVKESHHQNFYIDQALWVVIWFTNISSLFEFQCYLCTKSWAGLFWRAKEKKQRNEKKSKQIKVKMFIYVQKASKELSEVTIENQTIESRFLFPPL